MTKITETTNMQRVVSFDEIDPKDQAIVRKIEEQYPEMMQEYRRINTEQYVLFCKKQNSYGPSNISLGSTLQTEDDRRMSLTGLFFRMNDKIQRIKQLVVLGKDNHVKDENIVDTYQDLSVYSVIAQLVKCGKWGR